MDRHALGARKLRAPQSCPTCISVVPCGSIKNEAPRVGLGTTECLVQRISFFCN
jgi:hypothetical protein